MTTFCDGRSQPTDTLLLNQGHSCSQESVRTGGDPEYWGNARNRCRVQKLEERTWGLEEATGTRGEHLGQVSARQQT